MKEQFSRTQILLGEEAMEKLQKARVAVFGIGGVGGYTAEALVRSGLGAIDLIDSDTVSVTNINRQLFATHSTVGKLKVEVAKERLLDINPELQVRTYPVFYSTETAISRTHILCLLASYKTYFHILNLLKMHFYI